MDQLSSTIIAAGALMLTCGASLAQEPASVCENPTFNVPTGSPFGLSPKPGVPGEPKALVAGNFFKKQGAEADCGCDLAVAMATPDLSGFVALLRGNDDGTFAQLAVFPLPAGEVPVAIVKARFKIDNSADLDGFAVTTQKPAALEEPGRVRIFAPDDNGTYSSPSTFWTADEVPIAMTVGDFNGDQQFDAAVISHARSKLTILLGTGDGLFSQPTNVDLNQNIPKSLTAGRFSGAGIGDDIAVGTISPDLADPAARRAAVVIVRPNASGGFTADAPMLVGEKNSLLPWVAAANLTAPPGATTRPLRDLAVAYVDRDAAGNPLARVKVMLGKDGGGFNPGQTHDLGAALTRSATVADLDDDGVADFIVSTYANEPSIDNGTIRFFQGKTGAQAGFHVNPAWFTIPATVGIRPQSMAVGRFGPKILGPAGARANMGLAVANALDLRSVAVFLGNGRGTFVQPTRVTTRLPKDVTLFLPGDFHSTDGTDPLNDLAYVSPGSAGPKVLSFLLSNGAGGFTKAEDLPVIPVGVGPHRAAKGRFDALGPTDIAIIDTDPDAAAQAPFVKMLMGRGGGRFNVSEFALEREDRPIAITAGRFSDQPEGVPLDLVVINGDGKITLLVNDGLGRFPKMLRRFTSLQFTPADIVPVDNLRAGGRFDLAVRDANTRRFMLLVNLGPVEAGESQFKSGGFFDGTGAAPILLVGEIPGNDLARQLDHIVTFDSQEIRGFRPTGLDAFDPVRVSRPSAGDFSLRLPYTIADFGDGKPGLAAPVAKNEGLGILQMKGDGQGGFTVANVHMEPSVGRGDASEAQEETDFSRTPPPPGVTFERTIIASLSGHFRSALHGNAKPDAAFITSLMVTTVKDGMCPNDPETAPREPTLLPPVTCMTLSEFQDCPDRPCFEGPCCRCREGDPHGQCPNFCDVPPPPPPPPVKPFCTIKQAFQPVITVFANTCGD
ncbi:MAG: hypothetical protein L0210_11535 [Rhodospirillales bacterium]|nr:hypothetical protein [Rhodospirillales bacterium]